MELKTEFNTQLPWGRLYGSLSENGDVLEFAWKDQNVILFMTTVHNGTEMVLRMRRRPGKTATNARTSRVVFGDHAIKELLIPGFINMYNHYMNGVDEADQLRSYYNTLRAHNKTWKLLWHFLLDTTVVNSYKIGHCTPERPFGEPWQHASHKKFRMQLARQLFEQSERLDGRPSGLKSSLSDYVNQAAARDHGSLTPLGKKAVSCRVCVCARRKVLKQAKTQKPLNELSVNTVKTIKKDRKRPQQTPRGIYGCALCGIHICNHIACWNEHLRAICQ